MTVILEGSTEGRKTCIRDVITPVKVIHEKLVLTRFLWTKRRDVTGEKRLTKGYCQYHAEVQGMIYRDALSFEKWYKV